jgi:hypothetical protein
MTIKMKAAAVGSGLFTVVEGPPMTEVTKQTKKEQLHWRHLFIIGLIPAPLVEQNCLSKYLPLIQEIVDIEGGSDCKMPLRALHLG